MGILDPPTPFPGQSGTSMSSKTPGRDQIWVGWLEVLGCWGRSWVLEKQKGEGFWWLLKGWMLPRMHSVFRGNISKPSHGYYIGIKEGNQKFKNWDTTIHTNYCFDLAKPGTPTGPMGILDRPPTPTPVPSGTSKSYKTPGTDFDDRWSLGKHNDVW